MRDEARSRCGRGPDGRHEYLRTSCGRELTVGRLALGDARHPPRGSLDNLVLSTEGSGDRMVDGILAAAVLARLVPYAAAHWWQADPAAGYVLVYYAARKCGRSSPCPHPGRLTTRSVRSSGKPQAAGIPHGVLQLAIGRSPLGNAGTCAAARRSPVIPVETPEIGIDQLAAAVKGGAAIMTPREAGMPETDAITVIPIDTPTLGDRSYLAHDGVALVVDPQRDIDRVLARPRSGVRLTHVFETHIHNDYVTGGYALARRAGAAYLVNADDPVAFARIPVATARSRDRPAHARQRSRPPATPSPISPTSSLTPAAASGLRVFTGGSLLTGRGPPDLLGPGRAEALARPQHASARKLARCAGPAQVFPTHGFGASVPPPNREAAVHRRPGEGLEPGGHHGTGVRARAPRRLGRLARLLRPDAPRQPAGPEPDLHRRPGPTGRNPAPHRGRRVGRRPANRIAFAAGHVPGS